MLPPEVEARFQRIEANLEKFGEGMRQVDANLEKFGEGMRQIDAKMEKFGDGLSQAEAVLIHMTERMDRAEVRLDRTERLIGKLVRRGVDELRENHIVHQRIERNLDAVSVKLLEVSEKLDALIDVVDEQRRRPSA